MMIFFSCPNEYDGKIIVKGKRVDCPDFVFGATVTERSLYQLKVVLRMFDSFGALCINNMDSIEKSGDKLYSYQLIKSLVPEANIPDTLLITPNMSAHDVSEIMEFPLVLKLNNALQGKGVTLINSEKELDNVLSMVFAAPYGDELIAQKTIMYSKGKDLRVIVSVGEILHSFVRSNENDFRSNIHQGGHLEDFNIPDSLVDVSINGVNIKEYSRKDLRKVF